MDQMAIENCSIVSAKESLPEFGIDDRQAGFLPSIILPEIYRTKSGKVVYPRYRPEERALHWALDRLAGWELPGKAHVEEYFRSMYRRNFRPRTYAGALTAIYDFLSGVMDSGKTCLEEITKRDIEAFIEHEQDRRLMLSTIRTKLHCVNAFLGYAIDTGVVHAEVLARRIRLKKPETLPRAMDPDDVRQFLSTIDNPRDRAMILVLLRTGMRIGELLNTKMNDLHLRDRKIIKGG
jgi:integrase/recombinase XerD